MAALSCGVTSAVDRIRTVDTRRLTRRLGRLGTDTVTEVLAALREMFL